MKELDSILTAWKSMETSSAPAILATVVDVEGSAYRRPGARMLITPEGERVGSISGGCLEGDIAKKAWWWTESGEATVRTYDTTADEDTVWELGLGCNGKVWVLLERVDGPQSREFFSFLEEWRRSRLPAAVATVISPRGGLPVGSRLFLSGNGEVSGTLVQTAIGNEIEAQASEALALKQSRLARFSGIEAFVEVIVPALPLVIFGAGQDAGPLVRAAKEAGWHVTVADGRPSYAQARRFPLADEIVLTRPDNLLHGVRLDAWSAAVVMNHSYAVDREIVGRLLERTIAYAGVLGPRARTEKILTDLGVADTPDYFHAPVGLDIGADTPEGIALSIVAEIQAASAGRKGGKLRERKMPIYSAAPRTAVA